ncbi:hypothetical protein LQZ21_06435 [Treponema sp. TIM-1]|uniref:hypothetical protein n=1 Tax=Treponema sp. TIM-1 TaxID=2898417 RepID=UPI00398123D1
MKKPAKIAISVAAAAALVLGVLLVVFPLVTSKAAEARLGEFFTEAGIPEAMWSVDRAYYVPLLGHLVLEKLAFGESDNPFLEAKKVTLALDTSRENFFAGSVDAREVSFLEDDTGLTIKSLSVNDFSVDTAQFGYAPVEAVKKLGKIRLNDAVFRQKGQTYFSLGRLSADTGYAEGNIPLSSSVSLKDFVLNARQFTPRPAVRPEYRLSNLELKNSLSGGVYTVNLVIDGAQLFTIKVELGLSLPQELLASGDITSLALIDYEEDLKINSFAITYTDRSFLDHVFELAGMPGGRELAAEQLNESILMLAMLGGVNAEQFAGEVMKFIAKPEKFELKTNIVSPVSFEEISENPFALNVSLSVNGGKPFTTGEQ